MGADHRHQPAAYMRETLPGERRPLAPAPREWLEIGDPRPWPKWLRIGVRFVCDGCAWAAIVVFAVSLAAVLQR